MFAESTSDNLPVICPFSPLAELYRFRGLAMKNLLWTSSHKLRQFKKNFLFPGQQLIRMDTFVLSRALVCTLLLWSVVALFMLECLFRVSFFPWRFFRCAFSSLLILTRKWVLIAHALPLAGILFTNKGVPDFRQVTLWWVGYYMGEFCH